MLLLLPLAQVLAEQPSLFYDLMGPPLLDLVFGKEAYGALRSYFRFLHITSEAGEGHKQVGRACGVWGGARGE